MGIFGSGSSKYETDVEKATNENNVSEDWSLIMDICDKAGKNTEEAKNYLKVILRRLAHADPHIAIQAATLLDACVKNSGKTFHLEIASRDFENEYMKLLHKSHPKVVQKLKESLKKWAEEDAFKNDPQLNLITSLYVKLKNEGIDFSTGTPTKKVVTLSKDPNVVQSQEEEDQIAKAIELSLKDTSSSSPRNYGNLSTSLYPSTNLASATVSAAIPQKEPRKVRALYDFEAAEDNELTFSTGEVILVIDDSDPNWWKGTNHRGEGLFPANFVTSDLKAEPETENKKKIETNEENAKSTPAKQPKEPENVEINEEKINRLLHLIHEADPTSSDRDTLEMQTLEREVNTMGPLIDTELERIDGKHAQLTQLSSDLVEALNLYHTLMPGPQISSVTKGIMLGYPSGMQPLPSMYNGHMPSVLPPSMMGPPFTSMVPNQERPFMLSQNIPLPHFPPGIQPLPNHMMQHHMTSMQPMSGMPSSLPPQSMPPQGLPPGLHHPGPQQGQTIHRMPPPSMAQGPFPPPQGMPNFPPGHIPPNFSQNGQQVTQTSVQNVPPTGQNINYPQSSNTHIM